MTRCEEIEKQNINETLFCILVRSYFPDIYICYDCTSIDVVFGKWDIIRYIPAQEKLLTWDDNDKQIYLNQDTLVELLKKLKIMYSNNYRKEDLKGY